MITRTRGGWRDRFNSYIIVIDSKPISKIRHGQRIELSVPHGQHELFLKIYSLSSRFSLTSGTIIFDAQPAVVIEFFCEAGGSADDWWIDVLNKSGDYGPTSRLPA